MALAATLGFEEGRSILSHDTANAFNSIYRHRFLPMLAEIVPSVIPYASNLHAREPPKLLITLDGGLEVKIQSRHTDTHGGPTDEHSSHHNRNGHKSRALGEF